MEPLTIGIVLAALGFGGYKLFGSKSTASESLVKRTGGGGVDVPSKSKADVPSKRKAVPLPITVLKDTSNVIVDPHGTPPPPPVPVPPPPSPQIEDPIANAIDPTKLGITMRVHAANIVKPNAPIDLNIKQSNGAEMVATSLLITANADHTKAVIQWMPPVDIADGGYFKELETKLIPGSYYVALANMV